MLLIGGNITVAFKGKDPFLHPCTDRGRGEGGAVHLVADIDDEHVTYILRGEGHMHSTVDHPVDGADSGYKEVDVVLVYNPCSLVLGRVKINQYR